MGSRCSTSIRSPWAAIRSLSVSTRSPASQLRPWPYCRGVTSPSTGRSTLAPLNHLLHHPLLSPPVVPVASVAMVVPGGGGGGDLPREGLPRSARRWRRFRRQRRERRSRRLCPRFSRPPPGYQVIPFGGGRGGSSYGDLAVSLQGGSGGGSYSSRAGFPPGGGGGGAIEIGAIGGISVGGSILANGGSGSGPHRWRQRRCHLSPRRFGDTLEFGCLERSRRRRRQFRWRGRRRGRPGAHRSWAGWVFRRRQ